MLTNVNFYLKNNVSHTLNNTATITKGIVINQVSIPPQYNVNSSFKTDSLWVDFNSTGYVKITLTNGIYTVDDDLRLELETQLKTIDGGFSVAISITTKKFVITHTTNDFDIIFEDPAVGSVLFSNIYLVLGFDNEEYSSTAKVLTSVNNVNLRPYLFYGLTVNEISNKNELFEGKRFSEVILFNNKFKVQDMTDYFTMNIDKLNINLRKNITHYEQTITDITLNVKICLLNSMMYDINDEIIFLKISY